MSRPAANATAESPRALFLARSVALLVPVVLGLLPAPAGAQVFLTPTPHPQFAIGPIFITAVRPSPRRSLVYRGRRTIPERRLSLGWVASGASG